jgi:WD40 repeat protein
LASSDRNRVRVWDLAGSNAPARLRGRDTDVDRLAFAPDGRRLVYGASDGTLRVLDCRSGAEVACLRPERPADDPNKQVRTVTWVGSDADQFATGVSNLGVDVRSLAFGADTRRLVTGSSDRVVRVWDMETGVLLRAFGHQECWHSSLALSPDGRFLASGAADRTVRVWEIETGEQVACLVGPEGNTWAVAFSPDGRTLATGSWDETVRLWDLADSRELACFTGHEENVERVAFTPDGRLLVSQSTDHTLRIWDVRGGEERVCLRDPPEEVGEHGFTLSPEGARIVMQIENETIRVWDVANGAEREVLQGKGDLAALVAGPERFGWRTLGQGLETRVEAAADGTPVAWLPVPPGLVVVTHPDGRTWAVGGVNQLHLFTLEGASW